MLQKVIINPTFRIVDDLTKLMIEHSVKFPIYDCIVIRFS